MSSTESSSRATASTSPISVRDLAVSYDGPVVLHDVDLDIGAGSIVSLLGPSGCGKTTLLRAIAGLQPVSAGTISIADRVVSGEGVHVPAEKRRIGMVFQDWALFPHLNVAKNVAYGLPKSDRKSATGRSRVHEILDLVGLADVIDRMPQTLSGGQQQRIALARALAPQPEVLLLDEPFSNLDTSLRVEIRTEVHRILSELDVTSVFVTHDQDEAFVLGDQVAVMSGGEVVQVGTPAELYALPNNPWVAHFVGEANLLRSVVHRGIATTSVGVVPLRNRPSSSMPDDDLVEGVVDVLIRPEDVDLQLDEGGSGVVELVEYYGHDSTYEVDMGDHRLRVRLGSVPRFQRGDRVTPTFVGDSATSFPAAERRSVPREAPATD